MIWLSCEELPAHDEQVLVTDRFLNYFLASVETHQDGSRGWENHLLDSDRRRYFLWTGIVAPTDEDWK
jgi:hypothetical protein